MGFYKKSDLIYDYHWTTDPDDPRIQGEPGTDKFNREEGSEMLYLINSFASRHDIEIITVGNKIERLVRFQLPKTIQTQQEIVKWLEENWSRY